MRRPPHAFAEGATSLRLWWVAASLVIYVIWSLFISGAGMLVSASLAVATSIISESLSCLITRKGIILDGSTVVTGLVVALSLPEHTAPHIVILSTLFGSIVIKVVFGGIGHNFLNPAMAGRLFAELCWPAALASPITADAVTAATPVMTVRNALISKVGIATGPFETFRASGHMHSTLSFDPGITDWLNMFIFSPLGVRVPEGYLDLFMGAFSGAPAFLTLVLSVALLSKRLISWRISFATIISYTALSWTFGGLAYGQGFFAGDMLFALFAGPALFISFFVATDPCTSPSANSLKLLYGMMVGVMLFLFSSPLQGFYGAALAILICNLMTLFLDWVSSALGTRKYLSIREKMRAEGMLQ